MIEKRTPLPVGEAVKRVMDYSITSQKEYVSIEMTNNRFLAEDLVATHDVPSFDRSPYDGYAIRSVDTTGGSSSNPITLQVVGEIGAGFVFNGTVEQGQVVRIMTGAQIPNGCDAVVMLEVVRELGNGNIELKRTIKKGDNISYQGEDTKKGTVLVEKGTRINPGIVALLATFGYSQVPVAVKPKIGVIATGTELLDVDQDLEPGRIRNSNTHMIMAQIDRAGGEPIYFGKLADDFDTCFGAISEILSKVDVLITTGGVSVGDYDYMPAILKKLGSDILFNKVAMRPGSVTTVATLGQEKIIYGLSGNPSACYVGFELFVRPVLQRAMYSKKPHHSKTKAILAVDFPKPNPFMRLVRSKLSNEGSRIHVAPSGLDKSGVVSSLSGADCLMLLPGGTRGYEKGMEIDVLLLEDQQGSEWPWNNIVPSYK
ncbi:gephyrin-like molybdotransferase Glp [Bacillus suaedae]|uniref:Molybdopterin molybdenumtransferase n=1 Tax=Halalkalibacter suaedae TaxID=2822140 RepID=A0A940WYA5_9BACI|nr:gephyrin-like molybdotransferase Glp [Bacillus suaedae]MBP3952982.1 molybdopterin molybdotransferase MoeA [Bacillus suaedae]